MGGLEVKIFDFTTAVCAEFGSIEGFYAVNSIAPVDERVPKLFLPDPNWRNSSNAGYNYPPRWHQTPSSTKYLCTYEMAETMLMSQCGGGLLKKMDSLFGLQM
jgi:hypothetical protein